MTTKSLSVPLVLGIALVVRGISDAKAGLVTSIAAITLLGCFGQPSRIDAPLWEPDRLASRAVRSMDGDRNGTLELDEVRHAAPGLAAGWKRLDDDEDGRVTAEELRARLRLYREMRTGLRSQTYCILDRGRPLAGARVRLIPESLLAGAIEPATGTTDASGTVIPQADSYDIPAMRVGYYRVEITSDTSEVPARFNTSSILGVEISPVSDCDDSSGVITLDLSRVGG